MRKQYALSTKARARNRKIGAMIYCDIEDKELHLPTCSYKFPQMYLFDP